MCFQVALEKASTNVGKFCGSLFRLSYSIIKEKCITFERVILYFNREESISSELV